MSDNANLLANRLAVDTDLGIAEQGKLADSIEEYGRELVIEALLRASRLLPAHELDPEKVIDIQANMTAIVDEVDY